MSLRHRFYTAWLALFVLLPLPTAFATDLPQKPNIVFFFSDDHSAEDAGCYGHPLLKTPVIDQLASEGIRFTHAFSPASVCTPARSATYTGLFPHRNGCDQNHGTTTADIKSWPHFLKALGYDVVLAGKVHVEPKKTFPFRFIPKSGVPDFLENAGDEPFCLLICYKSPHGPFFNKKGGYKSQRVPPKRWLPDTPETRAFTAAYYDNVDNFDHELGGHLYWLQKYGFAAEAVQIYASDHGSGLPFSKWTLYDKGIRVPLIVKWKNVIPPGTTCDAMVSLVDLLPTVIEIAGGEPPVGIDGQSILPLLTGKSKTHREKIFATYTNLGVKGSNEYPIRAVQTKTHKLIVNLKPDNQFTMKGITEADPRAVVDALDVLKSWQAAGRTDSAIAARTNWLRKRPRLELYRLDSDPDELENLADQPEQQETVKQLYANLRDWMQQQNDPLAKMMR